MNKVFNYLSVLVLLVTTIAIGSCRKGFENPPANEDPGLTPTMTIKQLKALHASQGSYNEITTDIIVSGLVVANDKSGNLYKEIYIQDETGGIAIQLDGVSLYNQFPVGRKVYLKCKGLYLSDYAKLIQIGAIDRSIPTNPQLTGIPYASISKYLVGGSINNPVVPTKVNPSDLTTNMQDPLLGTLIQLDNFEVAINDTRYTWADTSSAKNSRDLNIVDCSGNKLIIRSSGYSNFAGVKVPKGNGSVTAIYTIYNSTKQLIIRDTADAPLHNVRCNGTVLPEGDAPFISIADLRALYTGSPVDIEFNRIKGIVISDSKNIGAGNIILQDGNSGIDLFFGTAAANALAAFKVGDSLVVDITGGSLEQYNGLIEVVLPAAAVPAAAAGTAAGGSGTSVKPVIKTVAEIAADIANLECTLVTIKNANATSGTFSGNKTLTDASGSMTMRTLTTADFALNTLPTTCQNWTGYVTRFNAINQLYIRSTADFVAGDNCPVTPPPTGSGINLGTTSPFILNFDGIESGLPAGVNVYVAETPISPNPNLTISLGKVGNYTSTKALWNATGGGFKNYASATGLTSASDQTAQDGSTNRALGVRQVSNTNATNPGTDPGASFVFQLSNTVGKSNMTLDFLLQSLDPTSGRTTTWTVDYGLGDAPTSFTALSPTGTLATGNTTFSNNAISVALPSALNNQNQKVWIRIITLTAAPTGSSSNTNRASTAVDDFKISW